MKLCIYYDNPNSASDMYLKWLVKDCEEKGVEYVVCSDYGELLEVVDSPIEWKVLPMLPVKEEAVIGFLQFFPYCDIDNVGKTFNYTSATAQGIFNYIVENSPNRYNRIAVIGRGVVGKQLIDMLITHGYTVYEFNSQSNHKDLLQICKNHSDYVVGLADCEIFNDRECFDITRQYVELIDAANCFITTNKKRCGKWTREILLGRVLGE